LKNTGCLEALEIMQQIAVLRRGELIHKADVMSHETSLVRRFAAKVVVDVVPAALASLVVGCLLTQYQFGRKTVPPTATAQAGPASAEMMQLVRDEHAAIIAYLKAQTAAEQKRYAAEDDANAQAAAAAAARVADATAAATATAAAAASARQATAAAAAAPVAARQPATPHDKGSAPVVVAAAAPSAPPAIAPEPQHGAGELIAAVASGSNSLFNRTRDIEDHVVHATLHAVSAIGSIPNWIASWGHGSGDDTESAADAPQFGASS